MWRARQIDLLATAPGRAIAQSSLVWAVVLSIRLAALGVFILAVVAGFTGDQNPYRNIAPTLVWVIFWVGLVYISALVGMPAVSRLRLDRARLSQSRRASPHRLVRHRLFAPHLGRYGRVRPRNLAAAR